MALIYGVSSLLSEVGYLKKVKVKIKTPIKEHDFEYDEMEITIQDKNIGFIHEGNKVVIFIKKHLEDD